MPCVRECARRRSSCVRHFTCSSGSARERGGLAVAVGWLWWWSWLRDGVVGVMVAVVVAVAGVCVVVVVVVVQLIACHVPCVRRFTLRWRWSPWWVGCGGGGVGCGDGVGCCGGGSCRRGRRRCSCRAVDPCVSKMNRCVCFGFKITWCPVSSDIIEASVSVPSSGL